MIALNRAVLVLRIITGLSIAIVVTILSWFVYTVPKNEKKFMLSIDFQVRRNVNSEQD